MKQQRHCGGEDIHAGDVVRFAGVPSVIVFVTDSCEYVPGFCPADWDHLSSGVMIRQENGALIYLNEADEALEFVRRVSPMLFAACTRDDCVPENKWR